MNPLTEMRRLVAKQETIRNGTITNLRSGSITVRTRSGLKSFAIPENSTFKIGDTVRFQGNVLLGKAVSVDNIPIFKV